MGNRWILTSLECEFELLDFVSKFVNFELGILDFKNAEIETKFHRTVASRFPHCNSAAPDSFFTDFGNSQSSFNIHTS